jgi:hypothetical protein
MIKSFLQFINESHGNEDAIGRLTDINNLLSLGIITKEEYLKDATNILKSLRAIGSNEPIISCYYNDKEDVKLANLVRNWTGKYDEKIIKFESSLKDAEDYGFEGNIRAIFDNGIECMFKYDDDGYFYGATLEISIGDQTFTQEDILNYPDIDDILGDGPSYRTFEDEFETSLDIISMIYSVLAIESIVKRVIHD